MIPELSVVIPVLNESPNIEDLYNELTTSLVGGGRSYEIIIVDDGSTDETFAKLSSLQSRDPHLRIIRFRRNFGQTAAFAAGFAFARGRLVVTADGDRQNDPADIRQMADELEREQLDIVCGWRRDRKDKMITRRLPSILANHLISWATGVKLHDYGCSLKVFRSEVVKPLRIYGEMHRFLPAIASQFGVRIGEMEVNHRPRTAGASKYGLSRTVRVVLDLLTVKFLLNYSTRPLQIFGLFGIIAGVLGSGILGYLGYVRLFASQSIADRPLLLLGMLLVFIGVQLLTFGLLAELLARTYYESQNKPVYAIREIRQTPEMAPVEQ
jgi:glycosyltransferase involved in cell wall biosynthesis